jgi:hypothetical protein
MENLFDAPESKTWLKSLLHERQLKISFIKSDGTERDMVCTLSEDLIPSESMPKGSGSGATRHKSDEAQAVFDLGINEWRSFRWDAIRKIEFLL